jgi:predicted nuclease with TOPRIM domain
LEELRSKQVDQSEINRYKQSIQSKNDELENLRSRLNQAENRLKDVQYFESENRRLAELLVKREREIEELRNRPAPIFDTSAYDQ